MSIDQFQNDALKEYLSVQMGASVSAVLQLSGGRNSRVYKFHVSDQQDYVAKFYHEHSTGGRDGMVAAYKALSFLSRHNVKSVPEVVTSDPKKRCLIYRFVEGVPVDYETLTEADIEQGVRFLKELEAIKGKEGSGDLPFSAEACIDVNDVVENIQLRVRRLEKIKELEPFLNDFNNLLSKASDQLVSNESITKKEMTLSPSDFGFHNAVRLKEGNFAFLDFDYFGWDDPAKMVSDFLLHPGMQLTDRLKQHFFKGYMASVDEPERLLSRIKSVYPLFGLKWCLILLNEFLPHYFEKRGFAQREKIDRKALQDSQLMKARNMLERVARGYQQFPYEG